SHSLLFYRYVHHRHLPSFPTRRSSDLEGASALLSPIDWPEPFGLVMIEAMASGTPVIAFRRGSVPEIVDESVTGFIVDNEEEARSEEHTSELQSLTNLVCRLLLAKKQH